VGQSCTGHAVAALIDTVLAEPPPEELPEHGTPRKPTTHVSPYMLYAMARKYDEFPGREDVGSSLRGAFKGWYHHGVCSEDKWPATRSSSPATTTSAASSRTRGAPSGATTATPRCPTTTGWITATTRGLVAPGSRRSSAGRADASWSPAGEAWSRRPVRTSFA